MIDSARVSWEFISDEMDKNYSYIKVYSEVVCNAKTGVEMEALSSATAALLSVYDLTKGIDPALSLSEIYLNYKEGGKSGKWHHPHFTNSSLENSCEPKLGNIRAAVITISDRAYNKVKNYYDESGPAITNFLKSYGADIQGTHLVPDDLNLIKNEVLKLSQERDLDLIITTGGTGLCPRDNTPEALSVLFDKNVPGIGELLRLKGGEITKNAYLSRSVSGIINKTLVVTLPGSLKAVNEGLTILINILPHALGSLKEDVIHKNHKM